MICLPRKTLVKLLFATGRIPCACTISSTHGLGISRTALTVHPPFSTPSPPPSQPPIPTKPYINQPFALMLVVILFSGSFWRRRIPVMTGTHVLISRFVIASVTESEMSGSDLLNSLPTSGRQDITHAAERNQWSVREHPSYYHYSH